MKLCSIASGSSGNCIFAGSETTSLLIDAGISGKRVEAGLRCELLFRDCCGYIFRNAPESGGAWRVMLARIFGFSGVSCVRLC